MSAFSFQNLDGEVIKGTPDFTLIGEALQRFRDARTAMKGHKLDILEFPFAMNKHVRPSQDNVFIRYHKEERKYEIKVFHFGHYNARKLLGHFILRESSRENTYEMSVH